MAVLSVNWWRSGAGITERRKKIDKGHQKVIERKELLSVDFAPTSTWIRSRRTTQVDSYYLECRAELRFYFWGDYLCQQ